MNAAIGEACGWKGRWCPCYSSDLDAMHEAEKILTCEQVEIYCKFLIPKNYFIWFGINATARQRAEAFLRTLEKWEEAK
jgi:hypothetical protein